MRLGRRQKERTSRTVMSRFQWDTCQHRLFSYYKAREDDQTIAKLRHQQNLLVTGIIYPKGLNEKEAERFEAALFLSINSN
jgi:hypothetical protein